MLAIRIKNNINKTKISNILFVYKKRYYTSVRVELIKGNNEQDGNLTNII